MMRGNTQLSVTIQRLTGGSLGLCLILGGCSGESASTAAQPDASGQDASSDGSASEVVVPSTYAFDSQIKPGNSSVAYGGQVMRHVLADRLTATIGGLTAEIDGGKAAYKAGEVQGLLTFYYDHDATTSGDLAHGLVTTPAPAQKTWKALGSAKLADKVAGKDPVGQHKDWDKTGVVGWPGSPSPDALLRGWFAELDALAVARIAGTIPNGADGKPLAKVQLNAKGHDLQQLIQKFLGGALAFSQGVDDYLDDDLDGKGILSAHSGPGGDGATYTALEHQWDEGFGYFGAARDYNAYSDEELAGKGGDAQRQKGHFDSDGDGAIDLTREANFGHAVNCSKRDAGAKGKAEIDLSGDAWRPLIRGRARIAATPLGALPPATLTALKQDRDQAVAAWERCIAATIVHYINKALADVEKVKAGGWAHADAAKNWSELKGFALSLQFSRVARLSGAAFADLQQRIGDAPLLMGAKPEAIAKANAELLAARAQVMAAYAFPAALAGDDKGAGGW